MVPPRRGQLQCTSDAVSLRNGKLGSSRGNRCRCSGAQRVLCVDVIVDQFSERGGKLVVISVQGDGFFSVDVDGATGLFSGAGEADADVGGFGFAGAVDDAT